MVTIYPSYLLLRHTIFITKSKFIFFFTVERGGGGGGGGHRVLEGGREGGREGGKEESGWGGSLCETCVTRL